MSIEIKRRPYNINFAGNPVVYTLYDVDAVDNNDITFEVRIMFSRYQEGAAPAEIAIIPLTPYQGTAKVDIAELLNCQLEYYVPDVYANTAQHSGLQTGSFYIHYRSVTIDATNPAWVTSEENSPLNVVKGGISTYAWRNNNFFTTYYPTAKPFLTWQQRGRQAGLNEPLYLAWLNTQYDGSATLLLVNLTVTFTDNTIATRKYDIAELKQWHIYYLLAGAFQMQLQVLGVDKTIWYWDVYITDNDGTVITEKYRYQLDGRNDYNDKCLLYRNSLGGLDTLRMRGVIETTINLDGSDIEQAAAADWAFTGTLPAFDASAPYREMPAFKGDAGYLSKDEQERLRDAFLRREVYMYQAGRLLPAKLTTKQYRLRSTADKLFSLPIEWQLADGGSYYYTPENVDMGTGVGNAVCDARILIQPPTQTVYDSTTTVQFQFSVLGTADALQYKFPGFVDDWRTIPFTQLGSVSQTVQNGQSVTLYIRTVCDGNSYGQVVTYVANTQTPIGGSGNSIIRNNTAVGFNYFIYRNQTLIGSGTLLSGQYAAFNNTQIGFLFFLVHLVGVQPVAGVLKANGGHTVYNGTITDQDVHFDRISTLQTAIEIIIS